MIDWHNHILPGIDDGSKDVAESISMMGLQAAAGVSTVIATPHFYANDQSVNSFLERRNLAAEQLKTHLSQNSPKILLGAEVKYYQGISRMEGLAELKIEGSKLLLLEMPMAKWTEYMVRELMELSGKTSIQIVLAHIERYINLQKQDVWEKIRNNGILMQSNASFFTSFTTRRKAISLLKDGGIHFLGSDCHNITTRPPNIDGAARIIQKKLGKDFFGQMNEYGLSMLEQ